jgi:hypothetical protein
MTGKGHLANLNYLTFRGALVGLGANSWGPVGISVPEGLSLGLSCGWGLGRWGTRAVGVVVASCLLLGGSRSLAWPVSAGIAPLSVRSVGEATIGEATIGEATIALRTQESFPPLRLVPLVRPFARPLLGAGDGEAWRSQWLPLANPASPPASRPAIRATVSPASSPASSPAVRATISPASPSVPTAAVTSDRALGTSAESAPGQRLIPTRLPAAEARSAGQGLAPAAGTGIFRVGNQTDHPLRVALLSRHPSNGVKKLAVEGGQVGLVDPVHWDFAPGEGKASGLILSLAAGDIEIGPGDVLVVFAQDGSQRYWGPFVVGETPLPYWHQERQEWQLLVQP